jgi:tetratricopeptide (TPR) repeat protein
MSGRLRFQLTLLAALVLGTAEVLGAQGGDMLSEPLTWESSRGSLSLTPVPVPDLTGTEAALQETLGQVRQELVVLVQKPGVGDAELAEAFGQMGRYYHAHHLYAAAVACYLNADALAPETFRWHYLLGYVYYQASSPYKAIQAYKRALAIQPQHAPAQLRLATVYLDVNKPELAEPLLQKPLTVAGLRGAALFQMGRVALARRDYEAAVRYLKEALVEEPQATQIHYPLAMAYRGLGDIASARSHLQRRGEGEPNIDDPLVDELGKLLRGARTQYFRAIEAARDGHYQEAVESFRQGLALDPENVNARVSFARSLYLSGDRDAAQAQLAEALRRDPEHALGNFLMGVLLQERGSTEAALSHFRMTLAADPEHGGASFYLGNASMRAGRYAEAAEYYRRTVRAEPKHLPARLSEAMALLRAGAPHSQVKERLEEAMAEHPDQQIIRYALARLLATSPDDSVRDGERALALAKQLFNGFNSLENAETLAMAYAEMGRYKDAAALQRNAVEATRAAGRFFQVPRLEDNLAKYEAGQPVRVPFAENDPIFQPSTPQAAIAFRRYPTLHAY